MNERILELAKQTDVWCDQNHYGSEYYDLRWEEKFAELIVRDCIKRIESGGNCNSWITKKIAFQEMAKDLREHFGVE